MRHHFLADYKDLLYIRSVMDQLYISDVLQDLYQSSFSGEVRLGLLVASVCFSPLIKRNQ